MLLGNLNELNLVNIFEPANETGVCNLSGWHNNIIIANDIAMKRKDINQAGYMYVYTFMYNVYVGR